MNNENKENKDNEDTTLATVETQEVIDLRKRLAVARERKRVAEAARDDAEAKAALRKSVEAEEIEAADIEAKRAAEAEHGADRVAFVRTSLGCVILSAPNHIIYKRFRDNESTKTADLEKLVRRSLVYPDVNKFDRMLEALPAILDRSANKIVELAGFNAKESAGKS